MFTVASDVEELAIDLREFDPALEALYLKVEAANATGDQQEIKKADEAWCKRADAIQARILGWAGLPMARKFLEVSRNVYEEMLCTGMLMATRGMPFQGPVRKAVRG